MGWAAVAAIGSLVAGIGAAVSAIRVPKIHIPKIQIPKEDLTRINAAIEANKGLSDTARANIQQALQMYQEGKLTPQYQAMLDDWWNKNATKLSQRLAAMGLSNSTIATSAFAELQTQYLSNVASLLQKQLSDALSMTGLSTEYVNELMEKANLELSAKAAQVAGMLQAQQYSSQLGTARGQAFGNLASSFGQLGGTLSGGTSGGTSLGETESAFGAYGYGGIYT